jgi:hypothetical protein
MLLEVGFLPKEEQSRHARERGNPEIPHYPGHRAWMPACAGMTDRRNPTCGKSMKITSNEKNLPLSYAFSPGAEAPGYTAAPDESGFQAPLMGRCYVARSL